MTVGTVSSQQGSLFGGFRNEAQVSERELGITDLAASLVDRGWLPSNHANCLYVSAASDTRPLTYLGPEVLNRIDPQLGKAPDLFVYLDKECPERDSLPFGFSTDGRSAVEAVENESTQLFGCRTELLRVRIKSSEFDDRLIVVVRIRIENERFAEAALVEDWKVDWFVGICDGCGWGRNPRCDNQIWDPPNSIPLRLGVRYSVTDHLEETKSGAWIDGDPSLWGQREFGMLLNARLRRRHSWRRCPNSDPSTGPSKYDRWVHLFEVLAPDRAAAR